MFLCQGSCQQPPTAWFLRRYDRDGKNALNWDDIGAMVKGNANAGDPFGWTAGALAHLCVHCIRTFIWLSAEPHSDSITLQVIPGNG